MELNSTLMKNGGILSKYSYFAKAWFSIIVYFAFWGYLITKSLNDEFNLE